MPVNGNQPRFSPKITEKLLSRNPIGGRDRLGPGRLENRKVVSRDRGDALSLIKCARNWAERMYPPRRTIPRSCWLEDSLVQGASTKGFERRWNRTSRQRWPEVVSLVIFAFIGQPWRSYKIGPVRSGNPWERFQGVSYPRRNSFPRIPSAPLSSLPGTTMIPLGGCPDVHYSPSCVYPPRTFNSSY